MQPNEVRRLNNAEAAEYVGVSENTLPKWRISGGGPRYHKISSRVVYDTRDLDEWLAERRRTSTSDIGQVTEARPLSPPAVRARGRAAKIGAAA